MPIDLSVNYTTHLHIRCKIEAIRKEKRRLTWNRRGTGSHNCPDTAGRCCGQVRHGSKTFGVDRRQAECRSPNVQFEGHF